MDHKFEDQEKSIPEREENQTDKVSKQNRLQIERRLKRKTVSDLTQIAQNHKLDFKSDMRKSERIELLLESLTVEQLETVLVRLEKRSLIERFEEQSKHPVLRAIAWLGALAGGLTAIWAIFFTAVIDPIIPDMIVIKGRILSNMIEEIPIKGITVRIASFGSLQTQSDDTGLFELNVPELKPGDHVQLICNHKTHDRGYTCFTPWKGRFNIARDPKHVQIFYLCPKGVYPSTDDWSNGLGIAAINRSSSQLAIDAPVRIEARISPKSEINRTITTMAKMLEVNPNELMQQFKKWASSKNELDSIENKAAKEYANGNYLESAILSQKAAESSNDTIEKRAILHKQAGDSYYADQKYETAKKQYKKTLALYETILEKTPQQTWELRLAIANSSLASLNLKMDNKVLDITRDTISDFLQIENQYIDLANEAKKNGATSEWSVIQSNCGRLFNMLAIASRKGTYRKYFELSEEYFRNALTAQKRYSYATISSTFRYNFNPWAQTQFRLSVMLINKSAREDSIPESNATLKRAEIALRNALEFYTKGGFPQDWATLQYNLGMLEHMRQKKNVLSPEAPHHYVRAIEALNNSLEIIQKETNPRFWGQIHYQLGSIYQTHALANSGSKALDLFNTAEAQYKKSLQVYTSERKPLDIADVQIDLGLLYSNLANIQSTKNISHLEKATTYFKKAVAILDSLNKRPERWAFTQLSLSKTYAKQAEAYSGKKAVRYLKEGETSSRNALKVYSKSEYIDEWAEIQGLLGQIYRLYALHNNDEKSVDDLKTAIDLYKKSLVYFKEETHPIKWGHAKYGIALSSFALAQHFKEETAQTYINQSMTVYQEILRVWTKDSNPIPCAYAKREYGKTLIYFASNLSSGDESIECYQLAERTFQDALTVFTMEKDVLPNERAVTRYLLGNAQAILANNLVDEELAAKYFEKAKKSYQKALDFFSKWTLPNLGIFTWPNEWADTQYNLGLLYNNRANRTSGNEFQQNLKNAKVAFQNVLLVHTIVDTPQIWANMQNRMGKISADLAKSTNGIESVSQSVEAIETFRKALEVYTLKDTPQDWADTHLCLGEVLYDVSQKTSGNAAVTYLKQSENSFQNALKVFNKNDSPELWSKIKADLGKALLALARLSTGEKALSYANAAKEEYNKLFKVRTKDSDPTNWAYSKSDCGDLMNYCGALSNWEESIEYFKKAEETFGDALTVFTLEVSPDQFKVVLTKLGNSQADLAKRISNEDLASKYYEKAKTSAQQLLEIYNLDTDPQDWAKTQFNLGLLHSDRATRVTGKDAVEYYKKAEQTYLKALSVFKLTGYPDDWAKLQNELAIIYSNIASRSSGEFSVKNNKKAIIHLKNILDHHKPKTTLWASRQNELAYLLMELSKQTVEKESKEYLSQAFTAVQKSLSVTNQESNLTSWAAYQDTLGVILMELGKRETGPTRQEHFQNAEKAFKKSLGVFTKETHPDTWEEVNGNYEQLQKLIMEVEMQSNESSVIFYSNQLDSIVAI